MTGARTYCQQNCRYVWSSCFRMIHKRNGNACMPLSQLLTNLHRLQDGSPTAQAPATSLINIICALDHERIYLDIGNPRPVTTLCLGGKIAVRHPQIGNTPKSSGPSSKGSSHCVRVWNLPRSHGTQFPTGMSPIMSISLFLEPIRFI